MRSLCLIVNPAAGRGTAGRRLDEIESILREQNADFQIQRTSAPGEAGELAARAAEQGQVIVIVGGDGTLNEALGGVKPGDTPIALIPVGSGNDFAEALGVPTGLSAAVNIAFHGEERAVDIGRVNGRPFANSLAMGIDGAVAETMNRASWLPPKLAYHYGVVRNVFTYRNRAVRWTIDGERGAGRVNLLAVMNGQTYGGGYRIAPAASIDDGLLDVVIVGDYGVLGRIRHLPKLKKGTHLGLDRVIHRRARSIRIECDEPMPVAVDGERLRMDDAFELNVEVEPGGLRVIAPPTAGN